jgi:hypothetical protein
MRKILFLAFVALSVTACTGMPWVVTASSDGGGYGDRQPPPQSNRPAPPGESVMLGEQDVDFNIDHDFIRVRDHDGSFRALYFFVQDNDIELFNLVVDFGNGETQAVGSRLIFNEGSRSRLIDLNGRQRRIESIQFTYKTVGTWREGKAHVVVYGVR